MRDAGGGWRETFVEGAGAGDRYGYRIDGGLVVPDPAARAQEADVDGPSIVVDPAALPRRDAGWRGRPWEDAVTCEIHVGAATPEGTFEGLRKRLDHYADLGFTALELMPLADFSGRRNWGYDGVLPFAPDRVYGAPEDLRRLVEDAHGRGLMMFIDVVYNHFGPEGNYLGAYASDFFDESRRTPWGAALDFSKRPVRDFFIANALYWLNEYGFDGIRFDAVHAIEAEDREGAAHRFLVELARAIREGVAPDRHVHLVLENDNNEASLLRRGEGPLFDAQWNDDFHHILHRLLTGETDGYYGDYADDAGARLARCLSEGFDYQGEASAHRDGARRGEKSAGLPPQAFVGFLQNHDQVGNRAFGERIGESAPEEGVVAATALYMLAPQIPLVFMGEEWGARSRFPFFCDFHGELADAVREGRRREFARFKKFADPKARQSIPDPNAEETFLSAKLDWRERETPQGAARLDLFRRLIALRRDHVRPLLGGVPPRVSTRVEGRAVLARYEFPGAALTLLVNLDEKPASLAGVRLEGDVLFATHAPFDPEAPPAWSFAAAVAR